MDVVAVGFWGAFFGVASLGLAASLLAFRRSARRVALLGSLAALLSAGYALVFLGWVPVASRELLFKLQAATAIGSAAVLSLLLFLLLGTLRRPESFRRVRTLVAVLAGLAVATVELLPPADALFYAIVIVGLVALASLVVSVASVRRGERAGWLTLAALPCVIVGMAVLNWYAFHPDRTPWQLHAVSAICGIAYLLCIATAMWLRYAYLIEVSQVMARGPNFDPITSMSSYETGHPMEELAAGTEGKPCALIVVSISNLKLLEELHGRAAYNHALFVCASRLRRMALPGAELARLREDAFLLLYRHPPESRQLVEQARQIMQRMSRPVVLGTSQAIHKLEESDAAWEAALGLGLLIEASNVQLELTIAGARAMSRTAWSYASRMAWFDEAAGAIAELPAAE